MRIVLEWSYILTGWITQLLLPIRMDSEATFKPSKWANQLSGYEVVKILSHWMYLRVTVVGSLLLPRTIALISIASNEKFFLNIFRHQSR